MNFISGIPVLFGWIMYSGGEYPGRTVCDIVLTLNHHVGPQSAFSNWTMVGGLSTIVSLSMAEIAAAMPVAGGIYFWSYRLGGPKYGPFLSWMTAVSIQ
jgi:amino acid transporter